MTYAEIIKKLDSSKERIVKLQGQIVEEQASQVSLEQQLNEVISADTGKVVRLALPARTNSPATVEAATGHYDKNKLVARIVDLRDGQQMSFETIATTLNGEGLRPKHADAFSHSTVYRLYQSKSASN